jgi:hypothetical protein
LKERQKLNTNQSNFHGANSAIDLTTAIDSLAMAATTDREVMAQLTQTNQQLVKTNKQTTIGATTASKPRIGPNQKPDDLPTQNPHHD